MQLKDNAEILTGISINSPHNVHNKNENPNELSSRNNPKGAINKKRKCPQADTRIPLTLFPISKSRVHYVIKKDWTGTKKKQ
ncbi:conserved hypothetical protein [Ricinus communis]|uniref:Uncharacterized protein n=1 Tax=Ricinus communis TaxID=3988 RepID=B9S073_RICCO|nr:conserved hypothetical protein [Ricinus communis]